MRNLDLNLLRVLVAVSEQGTVSKVADKLSKSQPSVSAALSRLRVYFKDPLFLRVGNSMKPTPRGAQIVNAARSVLDRVDAEIVAPPVFDPATSYRPVKLALSDVGEVVFLPALLPRIRRQMRCAAVQSLSLPAEQVALELESGGIDLAIGYFPDLRKGGFYQQTLFEDGFACLIRADHPSATAKLTARQFLDLDHAVVRAESRTEEVIEQYFAKHKIQRRIVLTTPHFASTPIVVERSDLVVTVPEPIAHYFASVSSNLRVVELPFKLPRIEIKQSWHRRFHADPRNQWLRSMVFGAFESQRTKR